MNPYKWLYTHLTPWWKRPWTYVRRDFYHAAPLVNIAIIFAAGFAFRDYLVPLWQWVGEVPLNLVKLLVLGWLIGGLQFHFFWGTKWRKGQQGE